MHEPEVAPRPARRLYRIRALMQTPTRLFALVPCAGTGSRAGALGPKQYVPLAGVPLVGHTLKAMSQVARLHATMVVLAPGDVLFEKHLPEFAVEPSVWLARAGGATRAQTVANGLLELAARGAKPHDWVLVHDAARCLVRPAWVNALIDACWASPCGGLLACPLADTLKSGRDGIVVATIDRHALWQAQTPQMFRLGALSHALSQAGTEVTDEASAMEAAGHAPMLVPCSPENFKITHPADFELAERLLRTR
jgi:2-C-methyl-D-erythritol 4-phosphate cytidylyltransferase